VSSDRRRDEMRRAWIIVLALGLMATTTAAIAAEAGADLAEVRRATVRYHDVSAAESDGYGEFLDCFDSPAGGMGQHYVDLSSLDGSVDPLRPEAMVYEIGANGRLKLVAVEYIVPNAAPPAGQTTAPSLLGEEFHLNTGLNVWVLHAWIWKGNPSGVFEDFNPNVRSCPPE
jgi:hypothetical protein